MTDPIEKAGIETLHRAYNYLSLFIEEMKKLEAQQKPKRKKYSNISAGPIAKRRERRYKK